MKKIGIVGIGGVGGYFGGLLAKKYEDSDQVQVYFMARGEHGEAIREKGLTVETTTGNFVAHPTLVSADPTELGPMDLLLICTKSYSLEQSLEQYSACITPNTVLLPLLNGVDSKERIKAVLPQNEVWDGCVYVVSRYLEPGLVKETGGIGRLIFGAADGTPEKLKQAETLFGDAGFKVLHPDNILSSIWEKFLFISSMSSTLVYFEETIGSVLSTPAHRQLLASLLEELKAVARAQHITLPEDISQRHLDMMARLPHDSITSMYSDFLNGNKTETESLTGYVVRLGQRLQVPVPTFDKVYAALRQKVKQ
ncbi:2-dehydropantoate 2-reductase [Rufibacter immobilis]|uniref:2-dehydropantoate 2-reductase n=1 Tax=Rufibacter immobilis TaxID=1348778 RepID=A0A3M9MX93_9BACT|nr:2-dehydropantoate 2-reductase [Rufibacter immobilis]RNI30149.1 2-dehydropantoate 2-reductase [Rufibacter immobilis]